VVDSEYRMAYWSAQSGAVTILPGRPATRFVPLAWLDGRIAYAVLADGEPQRFAFRPLLETTAKKWRESWSGTTAPVTVSSVNPLFATSRPPAGALMLSDTNGTASRIAEGDFVALEGSPDGRYLAAIRLAEDVGSALAV